MKRIFTLILLVMLMGLSQAEAALYDRGTDLLGNKLIYDDDLNMTWYDYTKTGADFYTQYAWADNLSVTHAGTTYDDWELPFAYDVGVLYTVGVTAGYNITTSDMGHLYYTELENIADGGLVNTGPFENLVNDVWYWQSRHRSDIDLIWNFGTGIGYQGAGWSSDPNYALAVREGDVAIPPPPIVPEPISTVLFLVGGATLAMRRFRKK